MISSEIRNVIPLFSILLLLNVIFAVSETPYNHRYPSVLNNQRSADSGYRYAWFTRDVHDDEANNLQQEPLSPQRLFRMKMLKNMVNRNYQNNDEILSESNEKL
jgi:biopolymer transport protein ExbD